MKNKHWKYLKNVLTFLFYPLFLENSKRKSYTLYCCVLYINWITRLKPEKLGPEFAYLNTHSEGPPIQAHNTHTPTHIPKHIHMHSLKLRISSRVWHTIRSLWIYFWSVYVGKWGERLGAYWLFYTPTCHAYIRPLPHTHTHTQAHT